MVNTRYNGVRPVAYVNALGDKRAMRVAIEAEVEEDIGEKVVEEYKLLGIDLLLRILL